MKLISLFFMVFNTAMMAADLGTNAVKSDADSNSSVSPASQAPYVLMECNPAASWGLVFSGCKEILSIQERFVAKIDRTIWSYDVALTDSIGKRFFLGLSATQFEYKNKPYIIMFREIGDKLVVFLVNPPADAAQKPVFAEKIEQVLDIIVKKVGQIKAPTKLATLSPAAKEWTKIHLKQSEQVERLLQAGYIKAQEPVWVTAPLHTPKFVKIFFGSIYEPATFENFYLLVPESLEQDKILLENILSALKRVGSAANLYWQFLDNNKKYLHMIQVFIEGKEHPISMIVEQKMTVQEFSKSILRHAKIPEDTPIDLVNSDGINLLYKPDQEMMTLQLRLLHTGSAFGYKPIYVYMKNDASKLSFTIPITFVGKESKTIIIEQDKTVQELKQEVMRQFDLNGQEYDIKLESSKGFDILQEPTQLIVEAQIYLQTQKDSIEAPVKLFWAASTSN